MARPKKEALKQVEPMGEDAHIPPPNMGTMTIEPLRSPLEVWVEQGICCAYVQFKTKPVPPALRLEPVWELKLESKDPRYLVNSIFYTAHGVVFSAHGELSIVPLGNVSHVRTI